MSIDDQLRTVPVGTQIERIRVRKFLCVSRRTANTGINHHSLNLLPDTAIPDQIRKNVLRSPVKVPF